MAIWSHAYHMLVCSLPPLPARFDAALPITAERLQQRLTMLTPGDAAEMERMMAVLRWSRQFEEADDAAVVRRYVELLRPIATPLIREVLTDLMDVRMIVTALRRRRRAMGPPPLGIGRWAEHIRRHFTVPDFALGHVFPRLGGLASLLEQGDVLGLHRGLTAATWTYLKRLADDYLFSFEAVILYVARWSIMSQWQQLQAERGRPIFEALVKEALGDHGNVYG